MEQANETISRENSGDLIYYQSRGRFLVRSKGRTGTQAEVAKIQAGILGRASALSARIRSSVSPLLPDPRNRKTMYRLNNALQTWLRQLPAQGNSKQDNIAALQGFSFHYMQETGSVFNAAMPVWRDDSGMLMMRIPQFDSPNPIAPLPFSGEIRIHIIAVSCDLNHQDQTIKFEHKIEMPYHGETIPARHLQIPLQTGNGKLIVVCVSINEAVAGIAGAFCN